MEEARTADEVARTWIAEMTDVMATGALRADCSLASIGPATSDLAMDLAVEPNIGVRFAFGDEWGNFGEHEEMQIGFTIAKWLECRLPKNQECKKDLYKQIMQGLQQQLAQEARHLRRLHVAFHALGAMGVGHHPT